MNKTWIRAKCGKSKVHRTLLGMFGCALICGLMTVGVPQVRAVEQSAEAAATARQLQLEGARLQLQGNLQGAVQKYRESTALQPNPRLDGLIQQLEPKVGKKEEVTAATATVNTAPAPATPSQAQAPVVDAQPAPPAVPEPAAPATAAEVSVPPASPATVAGPQSDAPTSPAVEAPPVIVQHTPGTPEEALIYDFTDWFIELFPASRPDVEFSLQTNRNYTIAQVDGEYEVRLDPFILVIDKHDTLNLGPVLFRFNPKGKDLLSVRMQLAEKAPITSYDKPEAELTIGSQQLSGLWNRSLMNFDKLNLLFTDLAIEDVRKSGRLSLAKLSADGGRSEEQGGGWIEKFNGELKKLTFVEKNTDFGIESISGQIVATGTNAQRFLELRTELQKALRRIDKLEMADVKPLMADLDEYMQLFNGYASTANLQGFHFTSKDGSATLASVALTGGVHKEANTGKFIYNSEGKCNDFAFTEIKTDKKPLPVAVTLRQVGMKGDGGMLAVPPHLFAEIFSVVEGYQQVKKEEADAYVAQHGYAFAQKILSLIERYSGEVSIHDLKVLNAQPVPVTLDQVTLAGGFDVGDGQGGTIHTLVDFSGFEGLAQGSNTVPQAGRVRLELSHIPSLLHLISDPNALATGNMQAVQGQLMMNGMGALMQSGLTLTAADSFVAFPAAKITLALLAKVEPNAKYLSSGTLNLSMENPDELKRIVQTYSADPETGKMLATLTALADRRQEGGKTIDRIDAKVDAAGLVFVNGKDVTSMFFPPPPAQEAAPPPTK
ncbi:MAG: hypothetical protein PHI97_11125 [Desulfobulbus sp.]|nr:hypothetical protein [Desulfobulbus sp.]